MSNSPPTQGPALREARLATGRTVDEFVVLAGISKATYYNAESEAHTPSMRTRRRIRAAFEQIADCPRLDRVSELEAKVDELSQRIDRLFDVDAGAVA